MLGLCSSGTSYCALAFASIPVRITLWNKPHHSTNIAAFLLSNLCNLADISWSSTSWRHGACKCHFISKWLYFNPWYRFLFLTKLAMTWGTRSFFLNCVLKNTNSLTQRLICKPMSTGEYKFHELLLWKIEWSTPASTSTFAAHQTSFPRLFSISLTCTIFPSLSQIPHSWLHFNFCHSGSCCSDKQWQVIWSLALLCFAPYFHPSWGS